MKILVTGGAGFIGSHIAEELVRQKHDVRILDNFSAGKMDNIRGFAKKVELIEGTVTSKPTVDDAVKGCDYVFHEAAFVSVAESIKNPVKTWDINIRGTLLVLGAAYRSRVKRVVLASSASVYGDTLALPKREDGSLAPKSPYGESKHINEMNAEKYFRDYKLETVCLRYFNVYGPRQPPSSPYSSVISKFISAALKNEKPVIYGDGEQTRDFIYVKDVVGANLLAMGEKKAAGEIFNVGSGTEVSINQLWKQIAKMAKSKSVPLHEPPRQGDIRRSFASMVKAENVLGFKPQCSLEEGLKETMEWIVKNSS
ncbi:MAG: SDR family oxidoreductase [Candidatus ainarchaeum sp.]|nr:SDR family oxidoreductase [Candidatus ainarchaeum sp.]MDD5096760.1 SDR family oxidoreductase [Candidatus ainarchaeum sp.]